MTELSGKNKGSFWLNWMILEPKNYLQYFPWEFLVRLPVPWGPAPLAWCAPGRLVMAMGWRARRPRWAWAISHGKTVQSGLGNQWQFDYLVLLAIYLNSKWKIWSFAFDHCYNFLLVDVSIIQVIIVKKKLSKNTRNLSLIYQTKLQ